MSPSLVLRLLYLLLVVPYVVSRYGRPNSWERPSSQYQMNEDWSWNRHTTRFSTAATSSRPFPSTWPHTKPTTSWTTETVPSKMGHRNRRLLPENSCGTTLGVRILGGTTAGIDEFPWMALLQYQEPTGQTSFGCGGSLISSRYVLTAAHCIPVPKIHRKKLARVRFGEFDTSKARDCQGDICALQPQDIEVEDIIVHKEYQRRIPAQYNDIALIRLKKEPTLSKFVSPICIPIDDLAQTSQNGEKLVAAGWGRTANVKGSSSDTKQKVGLPFVSMSKCSPFYARNRIKLRNTQMCAGGEAGRDSCSGDSGGPLMTTDFIDSQPRWFITGVVSFGPTTCGTDNAPGVYTKVSDYTNWILDNMKD